MLPGNELKIGTRRLTDGRLLLVVDHPLSGIRREKTLPKKKYLHRDLLPHISGLINEMREALDRMLDDIENEPDPDEGDNRSTHSQNGAEVINCEHDIVLPDGSPYIPGVNEPEQIGKKLYFPGSN